MKLNFFRFKKKINNNLNPVGSARKHWYWFLSVLSVLFVVVVMVSLGFIGRLNEFDSESVPSPAAGEAINRFQLDRVLKFFEDKASATEVLFKNPPAGVFVPPTIN